MPDTDFLAAHSLYIENTLRHAFLFDLSRHLLLQYPPRMLTILNSEVDDSGVDLVLTLGSVTRHIQMKTRREKDAPNGYNIAESLFAMPGGCVIWMIYDSETMCPTGYHLLGESGNGRIGGADRFPVGKRKKNGVTVARENYRSVQSRKANRRNLTLPELAEILFQESEVTS